MAKKHILNILCRRRDKNAIKHESLRYEELPQPGTLVAIDAEFVSMQQEEIEYRSDGSHKILRPARMSLARVSVLRGDGPRQGVPFIDDYIHTSEVIVDYLTEFSGIKCQSLAMLTTYDCVSPTRDVYSWRLGSQYVTSHFDASKACLQETATPSRSRVYLHWPWIVKRFPHHQYVQQWYH